MAIENLITDHLDLWTAAVRPKSSAGRGSNSKLELTGIKKLRELILELAVRGKLVPQDPCDEPASVLLERIAAEKRRFVKEGKIKKPKALPEISEEEQYFDLPSTWSWVRLNDIADYNGRPNIEPNNIKGDVWLLDLEDIEKDTSKLLYRAFYEERESKSNKSTFKCGDVLYGKLRPYLNKVIIADLDGVCTTEIVPIVPGDGLHPAYLKYLLKSPAFQRYVNSLMYGVKMPRLGTEDAIKSVHPLPPLAEQHRIVAKVDELMALCDQLELRSESQLAAHQTLVEALLATLTDCADADELAQNWVRLSTHFDTLFTTEASIDALKQTILQLAVMGKLVPQDPSDEPAIELFNRIVSKRDEWLLKEAKDNSEAMTMLRKLKKLTVPAAPFELPKAWACAHLIQLSQMLVDCHNKTAPYVEVGIPIVRTTNIRECQFIDRDLKFVSKETYDYWSRRCPPEPGDIIFTREAPMGEALIIPAGETWCLGQRTMLIRPMHEFVSNKFLLLALTEPHLLERASKHAVGLTVKHLRVGDVENLNIPLPPLAEQHRIVAKVDELMALCDQLKSRLQTSQQTQLALAESLAEGALEDSI